MSDDLALVGVWYRALATSHEICEAKCASIREMNAELLARFKVWLSEKAFSDETVRRHLRNTDLYINHYLLYEDVIEAKWGVGVGHVAMFLGYWFPKRAWTSDATIRACAASLRKFYTFLNEEGQVSDEAVRNLAAEIRASLPEWLMKARRYR